MIKEEGKKEVLFKGLFFSQGGAQRAAECRRACPTAGERALLDSSSLSKIFVWLRSVFLTATLKK